MIKSRSLNTVDQNALYAALSIQSTSYFSAPLSEQLPLDNVNNATTLLTQSLASAFDTVAPVRSITISSKKKPWAKSKHVQILMRSRDRAFKSFRRSSAIVDRHNYERLRASVSKAKSKVMILKSDKYIPKIDLDTLPKIRVDGTALEYITEVRNLGVIVLLKSSRRPQI